MARNVLSKGLVCLALFLGGHFSLVFGGEGEKLTYYVQLIRGNNEKKAPEANIRQIGPKLSQKLRPVFKWESYWEIKRKKVEVEMGKKTRLRLDKEREVEIDLTDSTKRTIIAYQAGRPISRSTRPSGKAMSIIGGDRDKDSVWFIVVRRDAPSD